MDLLSQNFDRAFRDHQFFISGHDNSFERAVIGRNNTGFAETFFVALAADIHAQTADAGQHLFADRHREFADTAGKDQRINFAIQQHIVRTDVFDDSADKHTVPIAVVKRDGRREFFDRHKLALGIERACQKRPVDAGSIAASIEAELQNAIITEISSKNLGEMVLARLKECDIISYIRFASIYREFEDIDSFMQELQSLAERQGNTKAGNDK